VQTLSWVYKILKLCDPPLNGLHLVPTLPNLSDLYFQMVAIAWDIETCPLPESDFSYCHQSRLEKEVSNLQERNPDQNEQESSRQARSFHPYLGWISCISVVRGKVGSGHGDPHSWTAASPEEEKGLLQDFWETIEQVGQGRRRDGQPVWVTFNGKTFDVPYLTARTAHHGLRRSREDITVTHRYRNNKHADLINTWPCSFGLGDLCDHLGVPNPKSEIDGSEVAQAVTEGRIDEVRRYCERDVVATYRCFSEIHWAL